MTLTEIFALIQGVLQFPGQVSALIKVLEATPEENRTAIMNAVQGEAANLAAGGRPTWS